MRKLLLSLCLAVAVGPLYSQTLDWLNTWSGKFNDEINTSIYTGDDNIFVIGTFYDSLDIDPGPATDLYDPSGNYKEFQFVAKMDSNGNYLWGKAFENPSYNHVLSFKEAVSDAQGNIYLHGIFNGTHDFSFTSTPAVYTANGDSTSHTNYFVMKVSPTGNLLWFNEYHGLNQMGQYSYVGPYTILLHNSELLLLGSFTTDTDFDLGAGTSILTDPTPAFSNDAFAFLLELDLNGNFNEVTFMEQLFTTDMKKDNSGNLYLTGAFWDSLDVDVSSQTQLLNGIDQNDMYVLKMDAQFNTQWAHVFGGQDDDVITHMELDAQGNTYLIGYYRDNVDFDPGPGQTILTSPNFQNYCALKYDTNGQLVWAKQADPLVRYEEIVFNPAGNLVVSGIFRDNPDFDPGTGVDQIAGPCTSPFCHGVYDIELAASNGAYLNGQIWLKTPSQLQYGYFPIGRVFHAGPSGNRYLAGRWAGEADFDPGTGSLPQTSFNFADSAQYDAFIMKVGPGSMVGISDELTELHLETYPNPVSSELTISWNEKGQASGKLFTIQGKQLTSFTVQGSEAKLDLSNLSAGTYFLEVSSRKGVSRKAISVH